MDQTQSSHWDLALWIDKLHGLVLRNEAAVDSVSAREAIANRIVQALDSVLSAGKNHQVQDDALLQLLTSCKVLMRNRRGIEKLLTAETLDLFLRLVELPATAWTMKEEALKCVINSVYSRPEFVSSIAVLQEFPQRMISLAKTSGPASFHLLVWEVLLVSCESPSMTQFHCFSEETWDLLHASIYYSFHCARPLPFPVGSDRCALLLEQLKLVTVLVNATNWTKEAEDSDPRIYQTILRFGELLLEILAFSSARDSPLSEELIEAKNKVLEVFMFLPPQLLAAFMQRSPSEDTTIAILPATALVRHLELMLQLIRVEKSRPASSILPTLIVCHSLTTSSPTTFKEFFRQHVLAEKTAIAESISPSSRYALLMPPVSQIMRQRFFYQHLLFFLTCLDSNVKRCTGEWLYALCDQNADEYTQRTGIGNAIGLLRSKGLT